MRKFLLLVALVIAAGAHADDTTPAKPWNSSLGAGLATTSGNTDTKNINLSFATKYDPKTNVLFKADALYLRGSANGERTVDKTTADARGEYTISARTFAFGEVNYLRDPFKSVTYFVAPLAGAGYRIIKTDVQTLTVDGGVGGIFQSGTANSSSGAGFKAGQNYEYVISKTSKVTEKLSGIWKASDFGDSLYHFDAGLTTVLATRLDLKLTYVFDYKNRVPAAGVKKGDSAFVAAVVVKF